MTGDDGTPALVAALLAIAGLPVGDDETRAIARRYPALRAGCDALYAVPGASEAGSALSFDPPPT